MAWATFSTRAFARRVGDTGQVKWVGREARAMLELRTSAMLAKTQQAATTISQCSLFPRLSEPPGGGTIVESSAMAGTPPATTALLLRRLERLGDRYGGDVAPRKRALLRELERAQLQTAAGVKRLHELLGWPRAYPDDRTIGRLVERLIRGFARRRDLNRHAETLNLDELAKKPWEWIDTMRGPRWTDAAFLIRSIHVLGMDSFARGNPMTI